MLSFRNLKTVELREQPRREPKPFQARVQQMAFDLLYTDASRLALDERDARWQGFSASVHNLRMLAKHLRMYPEQKSQLMRLINAEGEMTRLLGTDYERIDASVLASRLDRIVANAEAEEKKEEAKAISVEINVNVGEGEVEKKEVETKTDGDKPAEPAPAQAPVVPPPAAQPVPAVSTEDANTATPPAATPPVVEPIPVPVVPPEPPKPISPDAAPVTPQSPPPVAPSQQPAVVPPVQPAAPSSDDEPAGAPEQPPVAVPVKPDTEPKPLPPIVPQAPAEVPLTPVEVTALLVEAAITQEEAQDIEEDAIDAEIDKLVETIEIDLPPETVEGETAETVVSATVPAEPVSGATAPATVSTEALTVKMLTSVGQVLAAATIVTYVVLLRWSRSIKNLLLLVRSQYAALQGRKFIGEAFAARKAHGISASQLKHALTVCDKIGVLLHSNIAGGFVKLDVETIIAQLRTMGYTVDTNGAVAPRPDWMAHQSTYGELGYTPEGIMSLYRLMENNLVTCMKTVEALQKAKQEAKAKVLEAKSKHMVGKITDAAYAETRAELKRRIAVFGRLYRTYVADVSRFAAFWITATKSISYERTTGR